MAIVSSEKIFVDPKEEVTTVLERILKSEKNRVIIVLPQNSLLMSSYVTIDILFREIAKSSKVSVMVTEDEYGANIAKKAGFQVVSKVSQVTSDHWDLATQSKKDLLNKLELRKRKLLENFQGDQPIEESPTITSENEVQGGEVLPPESAENIEKPETSMEAKPPLETAETIETEMSETPEPKEKVLSKEEAAEEEAIVKKFMKPRREPKMTNIEGIEILSGGDILNENHDKENYDKIEGLNENSNIMNDIGSEESPDENIIPARRLPERRVSNFTGKDFTRAVGKGISIGGFFNFFKRGPKANIFQDNELRRGNNKKRRKFILFGIAAFVFLFLLGGYVLAFQSSSVNITLQLKKENVSTSASIIVDTTADQVTYDPLTIPGIVLKQDDLSISRTGEANGTGETGDKATGLIDLINIMDPTTEIVLNKGTKVTSVSNNLVYVLTKDTTVPKATKDSEGVIVPKRLEDVPVEAAEIGKEYNVTGTDSNTTFTVEGYSRSTQLQATRYVDFTGGTSKSFVAVSKSNVNSLKKQILPDIKSEGETKLKLQVPNDYRYLPETLEFVEKEADANPKVGEAAPDKTFNLSLVGSVTAIAVKNEDLEAAITRIIQQDKNNGGNVSVQGIEDLSIDKVEKSDDKLVLTVSSKSSLQKNLTIDQIKKDIAGKNITEAKDYLNLLEEVDKYSFSFSPDIVPLSLQRVPTDLSRINIKTQ